VCLHGKHVVDVSVGPSHVLAVTKSGAVYSWAWNERHDNAEAADAVAKPSRLNSPTVAGGCRVAVHCGPSQVRFGTLILSVIL